MKSNSVICIQDYWNEMQEMIPIPVHKNILRKKWFYLLKYMLNNYNTISPKVNMDYPIDNYC